MARAEVRYNFQPNMLFRNGPNGQLNACVGENGGPYDHVDYGRGFFDGAQEIVRALKERVLLVDLLVYPVCFSFRHGIELYLKAIREASLSFNKTDAKFDKNHNIDECWALVAAELQKIKHKDIDGDEMAIAADIIGDFTQIDPTGQVFRYPEDLKGNAHLMGLGVINLEVLSDGMEILHELLKKWYFTIERLIEDRRAQMPGA